MKIEAAFSASPRNTNPRNSDIKRLLSYCFITRSEEYNCHFLWPVLNDFFRASSRSRSRSVNCKCYGAHFIRNLHSFEK